jgi:thiamine-monophosphate kinase
MDSESRLVERIARAIPSGIGRSRRRPGEASGSELRLGIGDDAAVIVPERGGATEWVLSSDASLEGVHFTTKAHPADSIGYKSLVRATSDLAAMGATPRLFLLTLALPGGRTGRWLDEFLTGMRRAALLLGLRLAGGDTTKNPTVFVSITVLGEVIDGRAVTRAGARPGDTIYVSGRLGRAQLGLELILRGIGREPRFERLVEPHLYPRLRLELARWLAKERVATAMMDISDGLSTDLARLCTRSGVGARLFATTIPRVEVPGIRSVKRGGMKLDSFEMALHGGEDYELLFTVPARQAEQLRRAPRPRELTAIGEITRAKRIVLVGADGRPTRLDSRGWDPFRTRRRSIGARLRG